MIVFMDTFAFIAWINTRASAHQRVHDYIDGFSGRIVTTEWILDELGNALCAPPVRGRYVELIRRLRTNSTFEIVPYGTKHHRAGFDLLAARPDKSWSLTDCISFAVMEERGLTVALTGDRHFEQAGFRAEFR